jgi:DNA repair exonuclease SbcCD ATPase subunit
LGKIDGAVGELRRIFLFTLHQNKISMYEHVSYQHEQLRRQHEQLQRQHEQLQRQHEQLQQLQQMQQIQQVQQVQQMQQRYEQLFIEQQNTLVWFNDKIGLLHNEIIELRDLTTTSTISRIIGFVRRMYQFLIRR